MNNIKEQYKFKKADKIKQMGERVPENRNVERHKIQQTGHARERG